MSNVNTTPATPEIEYIVGKFEETERSWEFLCRQPQPRGPWVFVQHLYIEGERWPKQGQFYIVAITGLTKSGKARRGQIVASVEIIRKGLIEALRQAVWELDRYGRHQIVGEYLTVPYGKFRPFYNNGYRSNGADESPSIWFEPYEIQYYGNSLHECKEHLFCLDEKEIERAKAAKRPQGVEAAPDLGELLAAKMSQQGK